MASHGRKPSEKVFGNGPEDPEVGIFREISPKTIGLKKKQDLKTGYTQSSQVGFQYVSILMVIQDNWEKPRWRFRETSIYTVKLAHPYTMLDILLIYSVWWFGTFFRIFPIILGMSSSQLTHIFRGRYTTNQYWYTMIYHDIPYFGWLTTINIHQSHPSMPGAPICRVIAGLRCHEGRGHPFKMVNSWGIIPVLLLELPTKKGPIPHFFTDLAMKWHVFSEHHLPLACLKTCFPYQAARCFWRL